MMKLHICRKLCKPLTTTAQDKRMAGLHAKLLFGLALSVACVPAVSVAQTTADTKPDSQQQLQKFEDKLNTLAGEVDSQQKQIEELKNDLKRREEELKQTKEQLQNTADVANHAAAATATASAEAVTNGSAVKEATARIDALENPLVIHYKKLSLTPGGFIAAESVYRTRNENSDMGSSFSGLPFDGTSNANLSEFHMSARATRASVMMKTKYKDINITGYEEIDFFGNTAANDIKSNSFSPRQRQLWMRSDFKSGWSFTAGQMWSLMVRHKDGMATGQEESAPGDLIEGAFILGHVWERQTGFRVVKNFSNKTWVGFAVENPQTTVSVYNQPLNISGLPSSTNATSPYSDGIPYSDGVAVGSSTDIAPDLIAKVNFEPGWGHYEVKAIYRFFRTRLDANAQIGQPGHTYNAYGAGVGVSSRMPITKKLDFITEGLAGEGIGRYSSGGGADITLHPDGSPVPLRQLHASAGFEYRPITKLSTYVYEGNEYYQRAAYINSNGLGVGYGSPLMNNSQCQVEVPSLNDPGCTAQNRDINQVIGGFWYRFYRGPFGTMQYGMNYEHLRRNTWYAVGGQPKGKDDIVMTSFRFVLP